MYNQGVMDVAIDELIDDFIDPLVFRSDSILGLGLRRFIEVVEWLLPRLWRLVWLMHKAHYACCA